MAAPGLTARAAVAGAIGLMGVLAVAVAVFTAEICFRRALVDQREAIGALVDLAADQQLAELSDHTRDLGLALQAEPGFRAALATRDRAAVAAELDNHFRQYLVSAGVIALYKLVAYDDTLVPVAASGHGLAGEGLTFCPRFITRAAARAGPARLQVISGLCVHAGIPVHVTLVPVGGLRPTGYLEVVADPMKALGGMAGTLGLPVELRRADGGVAAREGGWPLGAPGRASLVAERTLRGEGGLPVLGVAVLRDMAGLYAGFDRTRAAVGGAAALAALLTAMLALGALKGAVLDPIRALCAHMRRIGADRACLGRPVAVTGSPEIRALAEGLNDMGAALEASYRDLSEANRHLHREVAERERTQALLKAARDDLERRVAERTQSLRRANEHLQAQVRDRRRAELSLLAAQYEAESGVRAKTAFLGRMRGSLCGPLDTLLGLAELVAGQGEGLSPAQREWMRQILQAGRTLRDLLGDLLDLARVESDRIEVHPLPVDLMPLLAECVDAAAAEARARQVNPPRVTAPPGPLGVRADPERLRRVLETLLTNAVRHSRRGGHIAVTVEPIDGEAVRVAVADDGRGIGASGLDAIFEPFASPESREGGAGVGLAVGRRLIERMGGTLEVESVPGRGSTFRVTLPAATVPGPIPVGAPPEAEAG